MVNEQDVNATDNPRAYMINDLLKNHLKVGLTRIGVLALLGQPYKDGIENRLPKGVTMPDSLAITRRENLEHEDSGNVINRINDFIRLNAKADTLMSYPVGWSTIDPNFLVVKFNKEGIVSDFWVEQH